MTSSILLLLFQASCMTVSVVLALVLAMTRYHHRHISRKYETSRWMLFTCMILFAVHYYLQIAFGFRAMGDDVGALINILFYSPAACLLSYTSTRMACAKNHLRIHTIVSVVFLLAILACFTVGWTMYHSLRMPHALRLMGAIFFVVVAFFSFSSVKESRRAQQQLENETGSDISHFNLYMRIGASLLWIIAIIMPIAIFSTKALSITGPIFLISLIFYVTCFVSVGYNLPHVAVIIDEEKTEPASKAAGSVEEREKAEDAGSKLSKEDIEKIDAAIEKWKAERGFSISNLNSSIMAQHIGTSKARLNQYLSEQKGETFRVWLSNIRIEEVKRMLLERDDFSNESIAFECGFSSRSWMQEKFKASTGMTPNEWKEAQKARK